MTIASFRKVFECICIHVVSSFPVFSPSQRSAEDLEVIYEELLHVKAAAHLSASVSHYYCLHICPCV